LLPTPPANDSASSPAAHLRKKPGRSRVTSLAIITEHRLLPTPVARDTKSGKVSSGVMNRNSRPLPDVIETELLPTPRASDGTNGGPSMRGSSGDLMLPSAVLVMQERWGPYAAVISRWEQVLSRPAPEPVAPGRTGMRLSPAFVEWMMGLPDGWVTGVHGLTRSQQLRILGNGVVPQQCALALRLLREIS
jgi:DNA (cytosine-5)-methyltransferase 1